MFVVPFQVENCSFPVEMRIKYHIHVHFLLVQYKHFIEHYLLSMSIYRTMQKMKARNTIYVDAL